MWRDSSASSRASSPSTPCRTKSRTPLASIAITGKPGGPRLQRRDAERLSLARQHEGVRARVELAQRVTRQLSRQLHPVADPELVRQSAHRARVRPLSRHDQSHRRRARHEPHRVGERAHQPQRALLARQPNGRRERRSRPSGGSRAGARARMRCPARWAARRRSRRESIAPPAPPRRCSPRSARRRARSTRTAPRSRRAGTTTRCSIEWKVTTDGRPARRAAIAPANATGDTTLACACTTSNPSLPDRRGSTSPSTPGENGEPRSGRQRRANAMHRDAVHDGRAAGRRDDPRVDAGIAQRERQVAQVQLDPAQPRQEPVADERHAARLDALERQVERPAPPRSRCGGSPRSDSCASAPSRTAAVTAGPASDCTSTRRADPVAQLVRRARDLLHDEVASARGSA